MRRFQPRPERQSAQETLQARDSDTGRHRCKHQISRLCQYSVAQASLEGQRSSQQFDDDVCVTEKEESCKKRDRQFEHEQNDVLQRCSRVSSKEFDRTFRRLICQCSNIRRPIARPMSADPLPCTFKPVKTVRCDCALHVPARLYGFAHRDCPNEQCGDDEDEPYCSSTDGRRPAPTESAFYSFVPRIREDDYYASPRKRSQERVKEAVEEVAQQDDSSVEEQDRNAAALEFLQSCIHCGHSTGDRWTYITCMPARSSELCGGLTSAVRPSPATARRSR